MSIITLAVILFLLMDPLGSLAYYLNMVEGIDPRRKKIIALREMGIALVIMLIFYLIGEYLLSTLKIGEPTLRVTSGLILFLIALKILFPSKDSLRANLSKEEPFITPLAIPLIAGPAILASIMLFAIEEPSQTTMIAGIFIAWVPATLILIYADRIKQILGDNGLNALERMMGMILVLLAVQRTLEGVQHFLPSCLGN